MINIRLSEMFTSIEGEGILFGTKTLFVRFAGCPLKCHWCDTPYALAMHGGELLDFEKAKDMLTANLQPNTFKVNFTGGEPLAQYKAVIELARHARSLGLRTYLESSCYDSERFDKVLPFMDICKIEFKLRDSDAVDLRNHEKLIENELQCLESATSAESKTVYIKVVISEKSDLVEFQGLVEKIFARISSADIAGFIIQPTSSIAEPSLGRLLEFYDVVYPHYPTVRVVPQLHKAIGAR